MTDQREKQQNREKLADVAKEKLAQPVVATIVVHLSCWNDGIHDPKLAHEKDSSKWDWVSFDLRYSARSDEDLMDHIQMFNETLAHYGKFGDYRMEIIYPDKTEK